MSGLLAKEVKQTRPFASLEEEVLLNLLRTTDFVMRKTVALLSEHALSLEQYNVLRILRGAGQGGLPCSEIGARMITRHPDITRLLDKLEARGLARRSRSQSDRRVVTAVITESGLSVLKKLDLPMQESTRRQLRHLSAKELNSVLVVLEKMRTVAQN